MSDTKVTVPLPKTVYDLIQQRKGRFEKNFNDAVEEIYLKLWENQEFKKLLEGTSDSDCVEGSESCDDHEAAKMVRDLAIEENSPFKEKKIHIYKIALRLIMRRYRMSRKERRLTVHGEVVQTTIAE